MKIRFDDLFKEERDSMLKAMEMAEESIHSVKVGAVIVAGDYVFGGYNRLPILADQSKIEQRHTVHAEVDAITSAVLGEQYFPTPFYVFVTHPPCSRCCAILANLCVSTIFFMSGDDDFMARHGDDHLDGLSLLDECGVIWVEVEK